MSLLEMAPSVTDHFIRPVLKYQAIDSYVEPDMPGSFLPVPRRIQEQ